MGTWQISYASCRVGTGGATSTLAPMLPRTDHPSTCDKQRDTDPHRPDVFEAICGGCEDDGEVYSRIEKLSAALVGPGW